MKAIILAAGQGTRLRPLTDNVPKCMVRYKDKCLIDYTLETLRACGVKDIIIVKGYKSEALLREGTKTYLNKDFATTNMLATLFCAENEFDDDLIISYSDIIYSKQILNSLLQSPHHFAVVIDKEWRSLWQKRMENPLDDAETLKLDKNGFILELGKKARSLDEIEGQYIGLFKIAKPVVKKIKEFYHSLDKNVLYDGKDFDNMFMTSFIQLVIDRLMPVKALEVNGGWLEVDSAEDLDIDVIL